MIDESLSFISTDDLTIFKITSKNIGVIGEIIYNNDIKKWVFYPEKNMFFMPVHVALILSKLNTLNGYVRKEKEI